MTNFTSSVWKDHHDEIGKAAKFLSTLFTSTKQLRFQITVAILVLDDGIFRWDWYSCWMKGQLSYRPKHKETLVLTHIRTCTEKRGDHLCRVSIWKPTGRLIDNYDPAINFCWAEKLFVCPVLNFELVHCCCRMIKLTYSNSHYEVPENITPYAHAGKNCWTPTTTCGLLSLLYRSFGGWIILISTVRGSVLISIPNSST